jgi:NodT family efflux transporter outer membrane factor (OMF) lipoprotein
MKKNIKLNYKVIVALFAMFASCKLPSAINAPAMKALPDTYSSSTDTGNVAKINWRIFFNDSNLNKLIDTAIKSNPEVMIALQEIEIARNNTSIKSSELLPSVMAGGGLSLEKVGRYTSQGAGDASAEITPGKIVPENLTDMYFGLKTSWEIDVWGKLRSAKKAAFAKYLSTIEGKNFVLTNLVAEVANSYYELLSYDNQLEIIQQNIQLQKEQLAIAKVQKEAAVVTELAVKQFEAQVYNSQSLEYEVMQKIAENENKINFLLGRYPQKIIRDKSSLLLPLPNNIRTGIPSQLLSNRPDIRQAEMELLSTKWELKAAQLAFRPSLSLSNTIGIQAFKPSFLLKMPESIIYSLMGDMAGPIINRKAITAEFKNANANQIEALYHYQKASLNGYTEVYNELSNINNLAKKFDYKAKEVDVLKKSIEIANDLFKSARANYLEVLTAQRDALAAKLEMIEVKKQQFISVTNIYKALGGGW